MLQLAHEGSVQYLKSVPFGPFDFFVHAFCTRRDGVSSGVFSSLNFGLSTGDVHRNVFHNWQILARTFRIPAERFVEINQVHGNDILILDENTLRWRKKQLLRYDAIITSLPGYSLAIKTADCVPLLLVDIEKRVIGAVHAGWRGTVQGITRKVVTVFQSRFGSDASGLYAFIGPAIGSCCYEVDRPVFNAVKRLSDYEKFSREVKAGERWMLDLTKANISQLHDAGISDDQIIGTTMCTCCCPDLLFSHRRERGKTGRQLSFIMIKP